MGTPVVAVQSKATQVVVHCGSHPRCCATYRQNTQVKGAWSSLSATTPSVRVVCRHHTSSNTVITKLSPEVAASEPTIRCIGIRNIRPVCAKDSTTPLYESILCAKK